MLCMQLLYYSLIPASHTSSPLTAATITVFLSLKFLGFIFEKFNGKEIWFLCILRKSNENLKIMFPQQFFKEKSISIF